ncbi:MAG: sulfatase [Gemmatimonadota bacterium]
MPDTSANSRSISGRDLLILALALGLWAGFIDLVVVNVDHLLLGKLLTRGRHGLWMTPVISAILTVLTALPFAAARAARGKSGFPTAGVFVTAALSCLIFLINYNPRVHAAAILLLSAGLAIQLTRWMRNNPAGTIRWSRRLAGAGLVATIAGGVVVRALELRRERASLGTTSAAAGAPNVLLIIFDTVRSMNVSSYGYNLPTTPRLTELAQRGVQFDWAISTAPWTTPSHATLFTGRFGREHRADWLTPMVDTVTTLAEALSAGGYRAAGFTGNMIRTGWEFGLDRGFGRYEDFIPSVKQILNHSELLRFVSRLARVRGFLVSSQVLGRKHADEVAGGLLNWLDRPSGRPFFAFVNFFDVHAPYIPVEPYATQFGVPTRTPTLRERLRGLRYPPRSEDHTVARYDANIARIDDWLGRLLAELDRRHLSENTLIIVTADHGEEFNEHEIWGHGESLYLPALHVPLIAVWPGHLPTGLRVPETVSLRDVPATILELAQVGSGGRIPGQSLAWAWTDAAAPSPALAFSEVSRGKGSARVPSAKGDMYSVVADSFHFIRNGDGVEELYQIHADPLEAEDLIHRASPAVVGSLRAELDRFRADAGPPR